MNPNHPHNTKEKIVTDIENTTDRDPMIHLMGSLDAGTDTYITGMEAAGQRQLVTSDKLPANADWPAFEALGFVKGEPVEGDPLFVRAALPEGWTRAPSAHSMHSHIVDERGVVRVNIFYKAAFYDRRADMHLARVGSEVATAVVYGDGPVALPKFWGQLSEDERADVSTSVAWYIEQGKGHPAIYGDKAVRAAELAALITADAL